MGGGVLISKIKDIGVTIFTNIIILKSIISLLYATQKYQSSEVHQFSK